jgi:hypothetical protein
VRIQGPRSAADAPSGPARSDTRAASWKSSIVSNSCRLLPFPSECLCDIFSPLLRLPLTNSSNFDNPCILQPVGCMCSPTLEWRVSVQPHQPGVAGVLGLAGNQGWTHISSGTPGLPDVEATATSRPWPVTSGSIRHSCMVRDGDRDVRRPLLLLPLRIDG